MYTQALVNTPVFPLPLVSIGNSQGIRLPKPLLRAYGFTDQVLVEQRAEGLMLKRSEQANKLSLEETFKAMAMAQQAGEEDWSEWDGIQVDGLSQVPWNPSA